MSSAESRQAWANLATERVRQKKGENPRLSGALLPQTIMKLSYRVIKILSPFLFIKITMTEMIVEIQEFKEWQ